MGASRLSQTKIEPSPHIAGTMSQLQRRPDPVAAHGCRGPRPPLLRARGNEDRSQRRVTDRHHLIRWYHISHSGQLFFRIQICSPMATAGAAYERTVARVFNRVLFRLRQCGGANDGGVDLRGIWRLPVQLIPTIVQCKVRPYLLERIAFLKSVYVDSLPSCDHARI